MSAVVGLVPLLALLVAQQAPVRPTPPVFAVDVERIRVEVLVTREGKPVRGLGTTDFEVRDSGVLQELEPVLEAGAALDTLLVLDGSESVTGAKLAGLREAAGAYLDGLRPGERASLLSFSSRVTVVQPLTADLALVRWALRRPTVAQSTSLCDAVYAALRTAEAGDRRTAVVVFSDGLDNASWLRAEHVVEAARRSSAVVYGVLAGEREERDQSMLRDVAEVTGGRVFEVRRSSDLRGRFLEVLEDIRSRYVLSYAPSGVPGAGWHPISVRLRHGRGTVAARPGYSRPPAQRP